MSLSPVASSAYAYAINAYQRIESLPLETLQSTSQKPREAIIQEIDTIAQKVFDCLRAQASFIYQREVRHIPEESINQEIAKQLDQTVRRELAGSFKEKFEALKDRVTPLVDNVLANNYVANLIHKAAEQVLIPKKHNEPNTFLSAVTDDEIRYFTLLTPILEQAVDKFKVRMGNL